MNEHQLDAFLNELEKIAWVSPLQRFALSGGMTGLKRSITKGLGISRKAKPGMAAPMQTVTKVDPKAVAKQTQEAVTKLRGPIGDASRAHGAPESFTALRKGFQPKTVAKAAPKPMPAAPGGGTATAALPATTSPSRASQIAKRMEESLATTRTGIARPKRPTMSLSRRQIARMPESQYLSAFGRA